jgi:hypothetical protein
MSENVEKVMDLDPGMENDPRENVKEIDNEEAENRLTFDLVNGICMSTNYDTTDWSDIYEQIPDIDNTILGLKKMFFNMVCTPVADRDKMIAEIMPQLTELHENMDLNDIQYELRPDITDYEKAQMMIVNIIIILTGMEQTAQIENLRGIVTGFAGGGLTDDMIEGFLESLNEIEKETTGDIPAKTIMEVNDETVGTVDDTNEEKNNE